MNHVMAMKCREFFFFIPRVVSLLILCIYKHKFKSIIYNRSGYEARFVIVSKQIYSIINHLKNIGAELEPVIFSTHKFLKCWSGTGAGAIDFFTSSVALPGAFVFFYGQLIFLSCNLRGPNIIANNINAK